MRALLALACLLPALLTLPTHAQAAHAARDAAAPAPHAATHHSATHHAASAAPANGTPLTPIPPVTEAELRAAFAPLVPHGMHDDDLHTLVWFNRLEGFRQRHGVSGQAWEGRAWIGTDLHRLWLRSDGERSAGTLEHADLEALYGRAVAPWWDALIGLRYDTGGGPARTALAVGVVGLAPYKFEIELTGYVDADGRSAARIEAEYETYLSGRWILQPLFEASVHGQNDPARGIGQGLDRASAGLRLRYEWQRQFAPYVGIERQHRFGRGAGYARDAGEPVAETRLVAGVRVWF